MSVMNQQNLKKVFEEASKENIDLMYVSDKLAKEKEKRNIGSMENLKEKQKNKLSKFLIRYKPNEILLVKCKENCKIADLFFKKNNYYLLTFVGILKTYEEVPFIIHDIEIQEDSEGNEAYMLTHDSFRIQTKYLFNYFKFIESVDKNECREDNRYQYVYFDHMVILNNNSLKSIFKKQQSVYTHGNCA